MLTQGLDLRAVLAYRTGAMQPIGLTTGAAASMLLQGDNCALLDVSSEILSAIESEMGVDSLSMPHRKPQSNRFRFLGCEAPPRSVIVHESLHI